MPHPSPATIREERSADLPAIDAVHAASFPEDLEMRLVQELRAAGRLLVSLVAEVDGEVIGHIAFSPVTTRAGTHGAGLGPVAVLPDFRRKGIAASLVGAGLDACRAAGIGWVVVLGDPAWYQRFDFRPARQFGLEDSFAGGDAFMARELNPGRLPMFAGLVTYAPEFNAFAD